MAKRKKPEPAKFKVGDWVTYPFHPTPGHAKVIEVIGPIGVGGEMLYRLREVYDWGEVHEFHRRESRLQPSDPPEHQPVPRPPEEWEHWTG
ncbi:MAG: hypothetical protein C0501_03230 [Isosphaera sp.]|nr:hypothetical protein [Isosphaera sp.]